MVPRIRSRQTGSPSARMALAGMAACALTLVCGIPYWETHELAAIVTCAANGGFAVAGALLETSEDARRRTGLLLLAGTICWPAAWLVSWNAGLSPVVSFYGQGLFYVLAGTAVLTYPAGRLTGPAEWGWLAFAVLVLVGGQVGVQLVSRPDWNGLNPDVIWPTFAGTDRRGFDLAITLVTIGQVLLAVWYVALLWRRARRLAGLDRIVVVPVLIAAAVLGCASATIGQPAWTSLAALESFYFTLGVISLLVPVAMLSGALRDRWVELSAPHRIIRMSGPITVERVRGELSRALRDPSLAVLFWVAEERHYVDGDGRPQERARDDDRWPVAVRADNNTPLALVDLDVRLRRRPAVVSGVLRAAGQALLTAQLQATAHAQLEEVLAAQRRLAEREEQERTRLERDLREGAERRLATLADQLTALGESAARPAVRRTAEDCHDEVVATLAELAALARGLQPPVLAEQGLGPALVAVATRLGLHVEFDVCPERYPAAVESTSYYAVSEALTNVAKHAPQAAVRVRIRPENDLLHTTVTDDGPGGARLLPGGGLAGIESRARDLGGEATLESQAGRGTRLHVVLPCSSS